MAADQRQSTRRGYRFLTSVPLLCCVGVAVALEVLVLFGLPTLPWLVVAGLLLLAGMVIAWVVTGERELGEQSEKRIAIASLVVATLSLVVAAVTFALQFNVIH